jgi:hypothetical protein
MNTHRSHPSKAQQLQQFMQEAPEHVPDLLALDGEAAWKTRFPDRPVPVGLRSLWRRQQVEQAAPRLLHIAAPLAIPLQTEMERSQLVPQLLSGRYEISDTILIAWMSKIVPSDRRLLQEQVEQLYPRINLQGYRAIAAEAARLGWPKFYREDLAIDMKVLCTPDAPKRFWWGIRSTGTDLYRPNELWDIEWAQARKKHGPDEQRYYAYTGETLRSITLDAVILHLARTLDIASYEQKREAAFTALTQAAQIRHRDWGTSKAYYEALQLSTLADKDLRRVKYFKQFYR